MRSARKSSRADGCSRKRAWCSSARDASGHRLCARAGRCGLQHTGAHPQACGKHQLCSQGCAKSCPIMWQSQALVPEGILSLTRNTVFVKQELQL